MIRTWVGHARWPCAQVRRVGVCTRDMGLAGWTRKLEKKKKVANHGIPRFFHWQFLCARNCLPFSLFFSLLSPLSTSPFVITNPRSVAMARDLDTVPTSRRCGLPRLDMPMLPRRPSSLWPSSRREAPLGPYVATRSRRLPCLDSAQPRCGLCWALRYRRCVVPLYLPLAPTSRWHATDSDVGFTSQHHATPRWR
jgi:hypothetical protein